MRQLYTALLFLFIVSLSSCLKSNEPDAQPGQDARPVIKGTRKVNLIVDKAYDLSMSHAHSIADSVSMSGERNGLAVPDSHESSAFFLDNASGEILAVVHTDTVSDNILVNAESVAEALMTLVPAYHSLSAELKAKFEREASTIPAYKDFVIIVDALLKNKQPIYSTDDAYIAQLLELNSYLLKNYLGDPNLEGGRVSKTASDEEFTRWLTRERGATLNNEVRSFVYAEFTPLGGGNPISTIIDPKPLLTQPSKTALSTLNLKDDCYTVNLNQTHQSVKQKNIVAFTTKYISMILTAVIGSMPDKSRTDCLGAIAGSVVTDVSAAFTEAANAGGISLEGALDKGAQTASGAMQTAYRNKACANFLLNKSVIARAITSQTSVILKTFDAAKSAYEFSEMTMYLKAIFFPIELSNIIQLYEGKLKEACVQVAKDGTLSKEYGPGETIYPGMKLTPRSTYANWEKSGFKVNWVVTAGNGQVNLSESWTDAKGGATTGWKLPNDKSGEVTLRAEIKDKEGDHLAGSPLEFKVTLKDSLDLYKAAAVGNWIVTNAEYPNNPPRNLVLYANGEGKYIGEGGVPFPNGGYAISWSIGKSNGRYYLYESGFWHPGYNQFRVIGSNKPNEYLTYPISLMKTYNNLGNGPVEALTYRKN